MFGLTEATVALVIGAIAGWLLGLVMRGSGWGLLGDVFVGVVGAFIGTALFFAFNFSVRLGDPLAEKALAPLVGALLVFSVVSFLRPRSIAEQARRLDASERKDR